MRGRVRRVDGGAVGVFTFTALSPVSRYRGAGQRTGGQLASSRLGELAELDEPGELGAGLLQ